MKTSTTHISSILSIVLGCLVSQAALADDDKDIPHCFGNGTSMICEPWNDDISVEPVKPGPKETKPSPKPDPKPKPQKGAAAKQFPVFSAGLRASNILEMPGKPSSTTPRRGSETDGSTCPYAGCVSKTPKSSTGRSISKPSKVSGLGRFEKLGLSTKPILEVADWGTPVSQAKKPTPPVTKPLPGGPKPQPKPLPGPLDPGPNDPQPMPQLPKPFPSGPTLPY